MIEDINVARMPLRGANGEILAHIGVIRHRTSGKSIHRWEMAALNVWSKQLRKRKNRRMLRKYIRRLKAMGLRERASFWQHIVKDW